MKLAPSFCALALLVLGCTPAESQGGLTLEKKLPASFALLSNVVELRDGRVAFADTRAKQFLVADLQSGKVDTLGTRVDTLVKNAPAEQYRFPGWVAHLAGDTVALVDFSGLRTTLWSEAGKSLGVLPIVEVAGGAPVLVYDTLGYGYKIDYQAVIGGAEPGHVVRPDSVPVLRIALKRRQGGHRRQPGLAGVRRRGVRRGRRSRRRRYSRPTTSSVCCRTGAAWLARGRENRVDWRSPDGRWTRGESRDYAKLPVTQADRDRVLAQVREHGKQFGMPQDLAIRYPFAATKPPFDFALGRPNGEVWLQRPRAQDDAPLTYDVFNRKGTWQRAVEFPKGASLAGFGPKGAVYGSIKESDGQRTVGRFKLK